MEIEEEGEPGRGLMLGDGSDDGNVDLGVSGVPQRVKPEHHIRIRSERATLQFPIKMQKPPTTRA